MRSVDFSTSSAGPSDTYILIIKCRYQPGPSDTDILSSSGSIKDLFYVNMFGCLVYNTNEGFGSYGRFVDHVCRRRCSDKQGE